MEKAVQRVSSGEAARTGEAFVPFDVDVDYRRYVDGKLRYDGVASFLKSRGIELPFGAIEETAGAQTVRGLGKLKDQYFTEQLRQHGVEVYEARDRAGALTARPGDQDRGRLLEQQLRGRPRGSRHRAAL